MQAVQVDTKELECRIRIAVLNFDREVADLCEPLGVKTNAEARMLVGVVRPHRDAVVDSRETTYSRMLDK
jgi:hypothetical protein